MRRFLNNLWREDDGVLSFEWTVITVAIVFGIVGGLAAGRDAIIDELGDVAEAVLGIDQSFSFAGLPGIIDGSEYVDPPSTVTDCGRQAGGSIGLPSRNDATGGA